MSRPETETEWLRHAIYDALKWLDWEAEDEGDERYAQPSRAILRGVLSADPQESEGSDERTADV